MTVRTGTAVARKVLSYIDGVRKRMAVVDSEHAAINTELELTRQLILSFLNKHRPSLEFCDDDLSVSWQFGRFQFQRGAVAPFNMLKALYKAGPEGLSHAELAEKVYGKILADVSRCADRLAKKLEKFGCPKRLERDSHRIWLEDAL